MERLTEAEEACHEILSALQDTTKESALLQGESPSNETASRGIESLLLPGHVSRPEEWSRFTPKSYIPVLGGGSSDDFSRSVVEKSIVIVVEHAGIEEFLLPDRDQDLISKAVNEIIQKSKLSREVRSLVRGLRKFWC